ncbi:MAG: sensor histidine kinase [Oscillospiraceae bacterium]|nr:sensor histidine kinase [Oscillospiraceae bacterium]
MAVGIALSVIFGVKEIYIIFALLVAVIVSSISQYSEKDMLFYISHLVYAVLALIFPSFFIFMPVCVYEAVYSPNRYFKTVLWCMPLLAFAGNSLAEAVAVILISMLSVCVSVRTKELGELKRNLIAIRDSSAENRRLLLERNKYLSESRDNEITLAVMSERNRIAREIHDNVGHMLSRTILQMGAVNVLNKDADLKPHLEEISNSLNGAMTSMRESVHNLHDDSVILSKAVTEIVKPLEKNMTVKLDIDISEKTPNNIKMCIIGIIREAVSNIIRHSNGDSAVIIIREHPAFYQASVEDNGSNEKISDSDGIGLENMKNRAEKAGGIFKYYAEKNSFKIFVSIPKER